VGSKPPRTESVDFSGYRLMYISVPVFIEETAMVIVD